MSDGSHGGWIPRVEDLFRLEFETIVYVGRDGVASSMDQYGKPVPWAGTKIVDPQTGMTIPSTETVTEQLDTTGYNMLSGIGPMRQNRFSPMGFLGNPTSFSLGIQVTSLDKDETLGQPLDMSSLLRTELAMYNNLMMDIGEATRFFDQEEIQNAPLSGSTPSFVVDGGQWVRSGWGVPDAWGGV